MNNLCLVKKFFFIKETFSSFTKNFFLVLEKLFFFNFLKFNCLSIFIAEANTIKWEYALAKALAFANCRGKFRMLQNAASQS